MRTQNYLDIAVLNISCQIEYMLNEVKRIWSAVPVDPLTLHPYFFQYYWQCPLHLLFYSRAALPQFQI